MIGKSSTATGQAVLAKADAADILGRFREIIADPLNLLIRRDANAGGIENGCVILHNGHRVPIAGPHAYYAEFSQILVMNRGVHEPLEEYVFQELLASPALTATPVMLELGAYWGHYSMWLKKSRPGASVHLVEPEKANLEAGIANFDRNGYRGNFLLEFVGRGHFRVADYLRSIAVEKLDILHTDIQGYELEMLEGCEDLLQRSAVDYLFISTHSQALHLEVVRQLRTAGYRVEVSSDYDHETTAFDGFVFAASAKVPALFQGFMPPARARIGAATPDQVIQNLAETLQQRQPAPRTS